MAETVLFSLAKLVLGKLGEVLADEVYLLFGVGDELKTLTKDMEYIQGVLEDAEKKQRSDESAKIWLQDLDSFLYEMDDLLDDIAIRQHVEGNWSKKFKRFFSRSNYLLFQYKLANQVRNLSRRLKHIRRNGRDFNCNAAAGAISEIATSHQYRFRETSSKLPVWDILGREEDKHLIVSELLSCGDHKRVSVIPIVGTGGLGKTTLAQLIYSENEVKDTFELRLWVYVSKTFSLKKMMVEILRQLNPEGRGDFDGFSIEVLQIKLEKEIRGKRYILILDDVWNENLAEWKKLISFLDVGATGSCIVLTTRSFQVATHTSTVSNNVKGCHELRGLPVDISLSIFRKLAFGDDGECSINRTISKLAEEIVDKSDGNPLILTVLGNLLAGNKEESKWREVINELKHGHEDVIPILKLSYDELSPFLKPCFRLASMFRNEKNVVHVDKIVPVWIALGFICVDGSNGKSPLEIGEGYIKELLSKSLLYDACCSFQSMLGGYIKMHDCLSDLATSVSSNEMIILNTSGAGTSIIGGVGRRVNYILLKVEEESVVKLPQGIEKADKARFFKLEAGYNFTVSRNILEEIISRFKRLRVLDLSETCIRELPDSIGSLKLLKMLNLRSAGLSYLPETMFNLINLVTLYLDQYCGKLPSSIGRLKNLRILSFRTSARDFPEEIGMLTQLRYLWIDCFNVEHLPRTMKHLSSLETLSLLQFKHRLLDSKESICEHMCLDSKESIEALQGLHSLRSLYIYGYLPKFNLSREVGNLVPTLEELTLKSCSDPDWIILISSSLKRLIVMFCTSLDALPTRINQLRNLEYLRIYGCDEFTSTSISDDFIRLVSHVQTVHIDGVDIRCR